LSSHATCFSRTEHPQALTLHRRSADRFI